MSDEIKTTQEEKQECKCFCRSEGFRNFLIVALGSFTGVFLALSLFAALHKPPMMPPHHGFNPAMRGCPCKMIHHHKHFNRGERPDRADFYKGPQGDIGNRAPFEAPKPEVRR